MRYPGAIEVVVDTFGKPIKPTDERLQDVNPEGSVGISGMLIVCLSLFVLTGFGAVTFVVTAACALFQLSLHSLAASGAALGVTVAAGYLYLDLKIMLVDAIHACTARMCRKAGVPCTMVLRDGERVIS